MKKRNKTVVPRNPFAVAATQRSAGRHEKTNKTKRQLAKQALKQELSKELKQGSEREKGDGYKINAFFLYPNTLCCTNQALLCAF